MIVTSLILWFGGHKQDGSAFSPAIDGGVTSGGTVNVAWHVVVAAVQLFVAVNVTVVVPPQASGAPVLLFVSVAHPLTDAVANQAAKAEFICACVWQLAVVVFTGQVSTTVDGAGTVNVAWQVVVNGAQLLV